MGIEFVAYTILTGQFIAIILIISSINFNKNLLLQSIVNKLPILTALLTTTGIILAYLPFSNSYTKNISDATLERNTNGFDNIQKMLSDNYDKCPKFIESINFDFNKTNYHGKEYNKEYSDENNTTIDYISNVIFQSIDNYLLSSSLTLSSDSMWISTFLSYFSSPKLRERWLYLKYNYGVQCRALVEYLIKIVNENEFKNSDDVINLSVKIIKTKEFNKIIQIKDPNNLTLKFIT